MPQHTKCHRVQNATAYKMPQHTKCKGIQNTTTSLQNATAHKMPQHSLPNVTAYKYQSKPNVIYTNATALIHYIKAYKMSKRTKYAMPYNP